MLTVYIKATVEVTLTEVDNPTVEAAVDMAVVDATSRVEEVHGSLTMPPTTTYICAN